MARPDRCQLGLVTKVTGKPVFKPTTLLINCPAIVTAFSDLRCPKQHTHEHCVGLEGGMKRSTFAQKYPEAMCEKVAFCVVDTKKAYIRVP
jgi:hypothetical protein